MDIVALTRLAAERGASDIHLVAGSPPIFRVHGILKAIDAPVLCAEDIEKAFKHIATEEQRAEFERNLELDFGYDVAEVGRLRVNVAKERGSITIVGRLIKYKIPTMDQLGLPGVYKELALKPRGLVIVTGPSGSGKSTTLSSMINYLNEKDGRRIVTIEDPIEFVFKNNKCTITQRELGSDTHSFAAALRHVLRQNPDVIMVGEMRDTETASAALTIAETGHLVLTTGHAVSASQSIERVIDLFPPHERPLVQSRLASLLLGVLCQALVPKLDGSGRVVAIEVMIATASIKNTIREGKVYQLPNAIMTNTRLGMVLLDQALVNLYRKGQISIESVFAYCNDPDETNKLIGRTETIISQL